MVTKTAQNQPPSQALPDETSDKPPRLSRTRKALIDAGKRLVSSGRMGSCAIDDIVREADVSKGSFFNHFADREALTDYVLKSVRDELETAIETANAGVTDAATRLARGLLVSFCYGMANRVSSRLIIQDAALPHPTLERDLQAGIDSGSFKLQDLDAGAVLVLGLSDVGLSRLLDLSGDFDRAREIIHGICILMLRSLGVQSKRITPIVNESIRLVIDEPRLKSKRL